MTKRALEVFDRWITLRSLLEALGKQPHVEGVLTGANAYHAARALARAEPMWISGEMSELVQSAAARYPSSPIRSLEAFAPRGFAWFDRRMSGNIEKSDVDERLRPDLFHGLIWWFQEVGDGDGGSEGVHLVVSTVSTVADLEAMEGPRPNKMAGKAIIPLATGTPMTVPIDWDYSTHPDRNTNNEISMNIVRTLWNLCQQRIAARSVLHPTRGDIRRAARMDTELPPVTVVTLRRPAGVPKHDGDGPGFVDWSHRWIVGGHWRNQWLPGEQRHEPRWIAPYVKGPEDKPLVADRVYELVR